MKKIQILIACALLAGCSEVHVLPQLDSGAPLGDAGWPEDDAARPVLDAGSDAGQVGEDAGPPPPVCINPIVRPTPAADACSALENALHGVRARLGCEPIACPWVGLDEVDLDGRFNCILAIDHIDDCGALEDHVVDCGACYFEGSL